VKKGFNLDFDLGGLRQLADNIAGVQVGLPENSVAALNQIAGSVFKEVQKRMVLKVNLTQDYVAGKMSMTDATPKTPKAKIKAAGDLTVLSRFDAKAVTVAATSNPSRLKGNAALGIAPGLKQAGVKVEVTRGAASDGFVPRGFMLPLKAGTVKGGNGFGVFARSRDKTLKHRYGPSPYALFSWEVDKMMPDITENLARAVVDRVGEFMTRELER
jgi:hypothetical protein